MLREVGSGSAELSWLTRLPPQDWIREGLSELARAQQLLKSHDRTGALLALRRASGMALNGALRVAWRPWGRTYVEHVRAIADDPDAPEPVRLAARLLMEVPVERSASIVRLTPPSESARWVEAAKTVMAHAYAVVHGSTGRA